MAVINERKTMSKVTSKHTSKNTSKDITQTKHESPFAYRCYKVGLSSEECLRVSNEHRKGVDSTVRKTRVTDVVS